MGKVPKTLVDLRRNCQVSLIRDNNRRRRLICRKSSGTSKVTHHDDDDDDLKPTTSANTKLETFLAQLGALKPIQTSRS